MSNITPQFVLDSRRSKRRILEYVTLAATTKPGQRASKIGHLFISASLSIRMERSTAVFRFKAHEIFDAMAQHLGMRYTYKETVTKPVSAPVEVGTEAVASLPKERRESLYDAAVSLSNEQFDAALLSVRERDPALAEGLAALTGEFRFDRILELLDDTGRKEA